MAHAPSVRWTDRFAFDIALRLENSGEDIPDILQRHNFTTADLLKFNSDPVFLKKVEAYRVEIKDKGITFRMKARAQAEELLTTSWILIHSPDVSPAVKADLIKSTVRWAGLESKAEVDTGATGGVRITINLAGQDVTTTLADKPTIELDRDNAETLAEEES